MLDNVFLVLSILNNSLASVLHWPFSKTSELWVFSFPISFVLCALAFKEDYFKNSNWFQFDFSLLFIVLTLVILENLRFSVCSMFLMILFHWPFSKTLSVSTFSLCSIISTIALQFVSTGPSQRPTNCECFHVFPVLYNFNNSLAIRFHLPFSKTSEHWVLNFLETVMGQKPSHDLRLIQTLLPRLFILLHDMNNLFIRLKWYAVNILFSKMMILQNL